MNPAAALKGQIRTFTRSDESKYHQSSSEEISFAVMWPAARPPVRGPSAHSQHPVTVSGRLFVPSNGFHVLSDGVECDSIVLISPNGYRPRNFSIVLCKYSTKRQKKCFASSARSKYGNMLDDGFLFPIVSTEWAWISYSASLVWPGAKHLPAATAEDTERCARRRKDFSSLSCDDATFLTCAFRWQDCQVHLSLDVCVKECKWVNSESDARSELLEGQAVLPTCPTSKWIKAPSPGVDATSQVRGAFSYAKYYIERARLCLWCH